MPRSAFLFAAVAVLLVLLGFFIADVVRQSASSAPEAVAAGAQAHAASAVDLGVAPSPQDIAEIGRRNRAAAAAADAAADAASAAAAASGSGAVQPAYRNPTSGAMSEGNPSSPTGSGRPPVRNRPLDAAGAIPSANSAAEQQSMVERYGASITSLDGAGGGDGVSGTLDIAAKLAQLQAGGGVGLPVPEDDAVRLARDDLRAQEQSQRSLTDMLQTAVNGGSRGAGAANKDQQWLKDYGKDSDAGDAAARARQLDVNGLVLQGTRIPVVGLEAVNSDQPGTITARSTTDIYDSISQRKVLIPRHTRFVGAYSSEVRPGQTRVLFAFRRMILPDGRTVDLTSAQGVDNLGRAGVEGSVDNHFLKMFGHSFAIAWISSRVSNKGLGSTTTENGRTSTSTVAGEVLGQVAQQILQRNALIPATLELPIGNPFFITLSKDVVLAPAGVSYVR